MSVFLKSLTVLAVLAASSGLAGSQKPVVQRPFPVEGRGAVATLEELWAKSDVVVEGTIEQGRAVDTGDTMPHIATMFDVRLRTIYKNDGTIPNEPSVIPVKRIGGQRDRGDRIEVFESPDYPLFEPGEEYILFLRSRTWSPPAHYEGVYFSETTYGPDSVFRIHAGDTLGRGRSKLAQSLAALRPEQLRAQLRTLGGGR